MQPRLLFSSNSPYTKQARFAAMLWTLLVLVGCFAPAKAFPEVDVPFADKWVHFVMFGGFALLWLCAYPKRQVSQYLKMLLVAAAFGSFIEIMQGILTFLGRSMEFLDAVADTVGGILGISVFIMAGRVARR
jgi:VanZ family protein